MKINWAEKTAYAKIVYYGPGLGGKTTNLQKLFDMLPPESRSKTLETIPTQTDRTLFFDFMPVNVGKVGLFDVKLGVYTVPGQTFYHATRKAVLFGTTAVVFVADSQPLMREENQRSLSELKEFLATYNIMYNEIPSVIQFNKRDLPDIMPVELMTGDLQKNREVCIEACAIDGTGVMETLNTITKMAIKAAKNLASV